jgi:hypothetical protein
MAHYGIVLYKPLIQPADSADEYLSALTGVDVDPLADKFFPQRIEGP